MNQNLAISFSSFVFFCKDRNTLNSAYDDRGVYMYMYVTDDEQINSRFDLAFYYYLVTYYTNCICMEIKKSLHQELKTDKKRFH